MRPIRAEPLYQIALYYFENKEYELSYLFALKAAQIPCPQHELYPLFTEGCIRSMRMTFWQSARSISIVNPMKILNMFIK